MDHGERNGGEYPKPVFTNTFPLPAGLALTPTACLDIGTCSFGCLSRQGLGSPAQPELPTTIKPGLEVIALLAFVSSYAGQPPR